MQTQLKKAEERMGRRIDHMQSEFAAIRAGRANPAVLDKVKVDYYGAPTPVNQLAAVSVTEARTLTIQPWDMSVLKLIEKAIQTSEVGINPQNDGKVIRLVFPPLTEARRKEIVKDVQKIAEDTKVQIRNVRRDAIDALKAMKKNGLFPCKRPTECTLIKSYQTTRTDILGKIFDWIYIHSHTHFGFFLMLLYEKFYSIYSLAIKK